MSGEIHKRITNPETGGSLDVLYKKDSAFRMLGHFLAIPSHIALGTIRDIGVDPKPELVDTILDHWKDVPWKGDIVVRIDHIDPKADWKRWVEQRRREGKRSPVTEAIGYVSTYITDWKYKIKRTNYYNSMTKTVHIYHPDSAVLDHELGHAQDMERDGGKRGMFANLRRELAASKNAMMHMNSDDERKKAMKLLEPALGTHISAITSKIVLYGGLLGFIYGELKQPKSVSYYNKKFPAFIAAYAGLRLLPPVIGHITSRLPNRKSSFGYIFSGEVESGSARESKRPTLSPHQVQVATARA